MSDYVRRLEVVEKNLNDAIITIFEEAHIANKTDLMKSRPHEDVFLFKFKEIKFNYKKFNGIICRQIRNTNNIDVEKTYFFRVFVPKQGRSYQWIRIAETSTIVRAQVIDQIKEQ